MIKIYRSDEFIKVVHFSEWSRYEEMGGYYYVWCEGYGP